MLKSTTRGYICPLLSFILKFDELYIFIKKSSNRPLTFEYRGFEEVSYGIFGDG